MEEEKVLVLIDADSLVYSSSKELLQDSIQNIDDKIGNIFEQTGATHYAMFISLGIYFRHRIDPAYKAQRKVYPTQLLWTRTLKNYLIERWGAIAAKEVEADDLVAYFYNKTFLYDTLQEQLFIKDDNTRLAVENVKVVLASPDKDLLQSLEGTHFNYTYRLADKSDPSSVVKGWHEGTDKSDVDNFQRKQLIIGDPGDNVGGLRGKGPAYWNKISKENIPSWGELLQEYITHYTDVPTAVFEFQKNYRLLRLLQSDSDFFREVGYIPEFTYHVVNREPIVETDEIPAF